MRMKTVRFRGRALIAAAISLVCVVALLRTSFSLSETPVPETLTNNLNNNNLPSNVNNVNNRNSAAGGGDDNSVNNINANVAKVDRKAFYDANNKENLKVSKLDRDADGVPLKKVEKETALAMENNNNIEKTNEDKSKINNPNLPDSDQPQRGDMAGQQKPNDNAAIDKDKYVNQLPAQHQHNHRNRIRNNQNNNERQQNGQSLQAVDGLNALDINITNGKYPIVINGKFIPTRRIVHIDLKGAPPQVYYFEKFFQLVAKLGGTGILIEYEDMFPYSGELAITRNKQAYSDKDIRQILQWAKNYNLEVMPLVQTFGHLEWILKHPQFEKLREVDRYAQVICLSNPEAIRIVKMAIDQVMAFHADTSEFFHMGADEAFQIGMCEKCQKSMREELSNSRDRLMIRHIANISSYVREKYSKRVMMWHDMLNNVDPNVMKEYKIGELVEPMVWAYAENLNDYLLPDMWMRFASTFPYIWGASAYKGADGPSRFYSNVPHYVNNHVSWTGQMSREYKNFREFRGLVLTGWQRFDHFAILCELLPVGVPSLAVNLLIVKYGQYDRNILKESSKLLECSNTLDPDSPGIGGFCNFPGAKVYQYVQQFKMSQQNMRVQLLDDYQLRGWLSPFNMRHNYSSAWYLDQIMDKIRMYSNDLNSLAKTLRQELSKIFYPDAVDEFLYEYVEEDLNKLESMMRSAQRIGQIKTFPGRPFPILSDYERSPAPEHQQQQQQQRVV